MSETPKATVSFQADADLAARLKSFAGSQGVSSSEILRSAVSVLLDGETLPVQKPDGFSKASREGKLTVRLGENVRAQIEQEARKQGVLPSTWAARILTARARSAPQPVRGERRFIQWGFRQLRGAATNLNQIATAMNRDVFTGGHYAPTRQEILELRNTVASLEDQLTRYAAGRLKYQLGEEASHE